MEYGTATAAKPAPKAATYEASKRPLETIVIHCSDGRFQPAFTRFLAGQCGLVPGEYHLIAVPGGPVALSKARFIMDETAAMEASLALFLETPSVKRVLIFNHEDCKKYHSLSKKFEGFVPHGMTMDNLQRDDALGVIMSIQASAPRPIDVQAFFARFDPTDPSRILFESL